MQRVSHGDQRAEHHPFVFSAQTFLLFALLFLYSSCSLIDVLSLFLLMRKTVDNKVCKSVSPTKIPFSHSFHHSTESWNESLGRSTLGSLLSPIEAVYNLSLCVSRVPVICRTFLVHFLFSLCFVSVEILYSSMIMTSLYLLFFLLHLLLFMTAFTSIFAWSQKWKEKEKKIHFLYESFPVSPTEGSLFSQRVSLFHSVYLSWSEIWAWNEYAWMCHFK